jgi:hypothetical protein
MLSQFDFFSLIEVVEHACGMATLQMGEYVPNVSNGIDTFSIREPLGVCAGICPFNFPAMIPLWVSLQYSSSQFFLSMHIGMPAISLLQRCNLNLFLKMKGCS